MQNRFFNKLRIGTRGSPLAQAQTGAVITRIKALFPDILDDAIETVIIRSSGEYAIGAKDERLVDIGGKGLFTKELEEALLGGRIDMAVHSMKDVPTWIPQGLMIAAVLEREDPRDVLMSTRAKTLDAMRAGAVIGSSSLRRQAQILNKWPSLKVVPLRGNVETRIKKITDGQVDGTLLALAGLKRLGLANKASCILETADILPAVSQGIVGIEIRAQDEQLHEMLRKINCVQTMAVMIAERAMLEVLDGSCHTPIAGLAIQDGAMLHLKGRVAQPEGNGIWHEEARAGLGDAEKLGREVGRMLRRAVPPGILPD